MIPGEDVSASTIKGLDLASQLTVRTMTEILVTFHQAFAGPNFFIICSMYHHEDQILGSMEDVPASLSTFMACRAQLFKVFHLKEWPQRHHKPWLKQEHGSGCAKMQELQEKKRS